MRSSSPSGARLSARGISFGYRGRVQRVLDDVSLDAPPGRIIGLLGPNGSGKTTLLRVMARMLRPERGRVEVDGESIAGMSARALARRIAVVPQDTHITFDVSVLDLVLMGRYPHLGPFALEGPADLGIAREALAATGTAMFEARSFATLSGGEKQRVVIAGALAQSSDVLLLDEPTAALDLRYQLEITELLARLNADRGTTMIVSTHDLNLAGALCHEIVLLREGRVLAHGPTHTTLTSEHIRALYDVDADVQIHPRAGHVTVIPLARAH